jgi:hypothetical protein
MAGPTNQQTVRLIIPPGEAQAQYSATGLAQKVQNFEQTPEGTLKSVVGPCLYEPERVGGQELVAALTTDNKEHYGVFHCNPKGDTVDLLIVRAGDTLYKHEGSIRDFTALVGGLSTDDSPRFPDQFVFLNNLIIWTNGVDRARTISFEGQVTPLGFSTNEIPASPEAYGPRNAPLTQKKNYYPNSHGYSWPGRIGTLGDVLDGQTGSVLGGSWYYHIQYEDLHGNLSALSLPSAPASISTAQSQPPIPIDNDFDSYRGDSSEIDDLLKQFLVETSGDGPAHCIATRIYRTPDTRHDSVEPRLLVRVPGRSGVMFPDNLADTDLGPAVSRTVPVPNFKVMCTHQGRLVIGNMTEAPGLVRRSEIGFAGTFTELDFVYPDSGGAEITGLASHNGVLLAFTENSVYSLEEFGRPRPLAQGIGCVAPSSIQAMPNGALIWLARDGFYSMSASAGIRRVSAPIDRTTKYFLNRSRLKSAVAVFDKDSNEYRCAVAPAGSKHNELVLAFDGVSWRRLKTGHHIASICRTMDYRSYTLFVGKEVNAASGRQQNALFVMSRETTAYTPPTRDIIYRSGWLRGDEVALTPINVRSIYLGLIDAWDGDFTITFYRNGSYKDVVSMKDVKAVGVDDESAVVTDIAGSAVIGSAKAHNPRLVWRQVPVDLRNVSTWAFEIKANNPTRLHLASFAFDISVATSGSVKGRIPQRDDV